MRPLLVWAERCGIGAIALAACVQTHASLSAYDVAVAADADAGLPPIALLTNAVTLTGANRAAFNFGPLTGDGAIEFILEGNPTASATSAYLAVGANASSNLRYEQFQNTSQLGFTQLGVLDYLFSPPVSSPQAPTHVAFVWSAASRTMTVYVNGNVAGTRSGVSASFALPSGAGFLGANPGNTENMSGVIYRVTVYDILPSAEAIRTHADAFLDIVRPPTILSFDASPTAIFTPESSTLTWRTRYAERLFLNGTEVTGSSNAVVAPLVTTTYTLIATNKAGPVSAELTLVVNPAPVIHLFSASRQYLMPGESTLLQWNVSYGQDFSIAPGVGDVTGLTENGIGNVTVQPASAVNYVLSTMNPFGTSTADLRIQFAAPADHLVISEFMAADNSVIADEDGEFSGWMEIYNPTASAISLNGYFLTDDASNPTKWAFPAHANLPAGGYLLVFASGKDRITPALHSNFSLRNDGEYLALVGPGPVLVHGYAPAFPPQRAGISYGILAGDLSLERYLGQPTPGGTNSEVLAPPFGVEFSPASATFTNPLSITLSTRTPGAQIRYTTDGSFPSPTQGLIYTSAVSVSNTTRLRAIAVADGVSSEPSAEAYIKLSAELAQYQSTLPIMVIENFGAGVIPQKGWNPPTGAGTKQVPRQDAVWATFPRKDGQSSLSGPAEMFSRIGIRGRGAFSTEWRQKPYSVEAMTETGAERKVSPLNIPAHADWVLYFPDPDANKDPSLLFNTFAYDLSAASGRYSVRFRWVEAFVNEDGGELSLADRRGVYAIFEKVSRGDERLNFERLSEDGSKGSWLLNINRMDPEPETGWPAPNGATQPWFFHTAGPNRIPETPPNSLRVGDDEPQQSNGFLNFDNPSGYTINTNQRLAIENWFKQFEDVLWNDALWRDPTNGYRKFLDATDFADYFILNTLTRNGDGLLISMFPWKADDGKLRMGPAWDYNWSSYYISGTNSTGSLYHRPDRLWYRRLFADIDFLQLYIDRWWDLRRGPYSDAAIEAIIDRQANDISPAKAILNGVPSEAEWASRLNQMKSWLTTRANWIDSNYLRPPFFNLPGGDVPDGFHLVIVGTNGTIYYTVDGIDPRMRGGAVAASAQAYQAAFPIFAQTTVHARIKNGTNWSGLVSGTFYPPQDLSALAITEIMYHPMATALSPSEDLEFLELQNTGTNTLQLGSLTFTSGINFTFTNGTLLYPGEFFVLARNPGALTGVTVNGVFTGRLDNGGESLRLSTPFGETVLEVTYNDRDPWPLPADGYGFSAVPRASPDNSDNGVHWRASANPGGSPGAPDPEPAAPGIRINELLTNTDAPLTDAIELFNPSPQSANIGGWFLSDDGDVPRKFRIPAGTIIEGNGYVVFTEQDFNPDPGTLLNFSLNSFGDSLYLCAADEQTNFTGYSHSLAYGAAANGVSFGRYVNSVGEEQFPGQTAETLGSANVGPIIGPVIIQEIHYHPATDGDEFVELRNISAQKIALFDGTNTWYINGLAFAFPPGIVLPADATLLVVAMDPAAFRVKHSVSDNVQILGPFLGTLQDNGERLELQRPGATEPQGVPYIVVDAVRYNDKAPWSPAADGGGPSLQRVHPLQYGDDPINWRAALPTPGTHSAPGAAPMITEQPQSQTAPANQTVSFTISASGSGTLLFQWLFEGAPIFGATNSTLLLERVSPSDAGEYRAVVYNNEGSVLSLSARLAVLFPPGIQIQPRSVATNVSQRVTFSVSAYGVGPLQYQWFFDGNPIPDATNTSHTIMSVQSSHEGLYSVLVTDSFASTLSHEARLTVYAPPAFIENPQTQSIFAGENVTFQVRVSGSAPFGYRWRQNSTNIVVFPGAPVVTLSNVPLSFNGYRIDCVATNIARSGGVLSSPAFIYVFADSDGDRMADTWETAHGLSPTNSADGGIDADGDTLTNREEYVAGTDPQDPMSYLKIERINSSNTARVQFNAVSNKTYTVEYNDTPGLGGWLKLTDVLSVTNNRLQSVNDSNSPPQRFYRLVTPRTFQ